MSIGSGCGLKNQGKSSLLQALVLLHQTIREHEWSTRLMLNGNTLRLGTVLDVVDKIHGHHIFTIAIEAYSHEYRWTFSGDRSEMSMDVVQVEIDGKNMDSFPRLKCLLPEICIPDAAHMAERLRAMTYITAERIGPREF